MHDERYPTDSHPGAPAGSHSVPPPEASLKAVYFVHELAERWHLHPESIRRLIRERKLKPLRGFRPFRITYDEIRRYETHDEAEERQRAILARHGR